MQARRLGRMTPSNDCSLQVPINTRPEWPVWLDCSKHRHKGRHVVIVASLKTKSF